VPAARQSEWVALAVAALDETQGDVGKAVATANACLESGPADKLPTAKALSPRQTLVSRVLARFGFRVPDKKALEEFLSGNAEAGRLYDATFGKQSFGGLDKLLAACKRELDLGKGLRAQAARVNGLLSGSHE
jgi:hypothetical protein